jgi:hypothetical protein
LQPSKPPLTARKAFITDGRTISQAESDMGIVEFLQTRHYRRGADRGNERERQFIYAAGGIHDHMDWHEGIETERFTPSRSRDHSRRCCVAH